MTGSDQLCAYIAVSIVIVKKLNNRFGYTNSRSIISRNNFLEGGIAF